MGAASLRMYTPATLCGCRGCNGSAPPHTLIRGLPRVVRRVARPRAGRARCCSRRAHQDGVGGGIAQQAGHFGLLARQCLVGGCIAGGRAGSSGKRSKEEEDRERRQSGGQRRQRRRDARAAVLTAQTGARGHRSRPRSERTAARPSDLWVQGSVLCSFSHSRCQEGAIHDPARTRLIGRLIDIFLRL